MYDMYASVEIRGDGRKSAKLYSLEMHVGMIAFDQMQPLQ